MLRVGLQFVIVACSVQTQLQFVFCRVLDTLVMQFADILLMVHSNKHAIMQSWFRYCTSCQNIYRYQNMN